MARYLTIIYASLKTAANRFRLSVCNSLGLTLIETVIALAMFSSAGTAVLLGVSAAHTSSDRVSASAIAENLARNQMEYVSSLDYVPAGTPYPSVADDSGLNISIPTGYAVTAATETYISSDDYGGAIQKVIVTVTRDGQSILVLESLRTNP